MRARTEGEARIEAHDRGIRDGISGDVVVPRHDPGTRAEAHRLERIQPRAFPVLVVDAFEPRLRPVELRFRGFQFGQQRERVGIAVEQRLQLHLVPQRGFADTGFEDRLFVGGV